MVALLRGVNVGGHGKLAMSDLRRVCEEQGLADVKTYIQSGNVVFSTSLKAASVEKRLGDALGTEVFVRTRDELAQVLERSPFRVKDPTHLHVTFTRDARASEELDGVDVERFAPEQARVVGREVYLHLPNGIGRSKLAAVLGRRGGVGTTRNLRTLEKLLELLDA